VGPAANTAGAPQTSAGISFFHNGSSVTSSGASTRRQILIDFSGPAGKYSVTVRATTGGGAKFDAWLNTINGKGQFLNNIVPGYTVWDGASAFNNITPNDYVLREKWANDIGVVSGIRADHVGDLWSGSGVGPLVDGRLGVDISAPGNTVFTSLAPKSTYSAGSKIQDGNGFYTAQNAVSGASPQVTVIVALMLELNPTLDAKQVKETLQQTARRDDFTGAVPNARWGYGKIDALAALTAASRLPGARAYYSVDRNVISIDYPQGSAAPAAQNVAVTAGGSAGSFVTSSSATWLTADAASGTPPAQLAIRASATGLALGDYSGEITITSTDGKAVPQSIMVHLHVRTPGPLITGVTDGAAFGPGFANGSWLTITGYDLAGTTRIWEGKDFQGDRLPTALDGTSVVVFDRAAYVYFVSPTQLNVLAPDNPTTNTRFAIQVTRNGVRSNTFVANTLARNPEFFRFDGRYIAAVHLNGDLVAKADLFPGLLTRPVKPGDIIQMYGTGCGATSPVLPADRIVAAPAEVTGTVKLTIGGKAATASFVGVTGSGLCQINGQVPDLPAGDAEVVLQIDSFVSADGAFITVQ
jgi:uncharacterized protein (TIGR03437 family)